MHEQQAKVIPVFEQYTHDLTDTQKLFLAKKVKVYFEKTVFGFDGGEDETGKNEEQVYLAYDTDFHERDGGYLIGIVEPLRAYIARMERGVLPKVSNMRKTLKDVFTKEIERLPKYPETLEPKDRLNFICKMVPYVLTKVEAVASTIDEKDDPSSCGVPIFSTDLVPFQKNQKAMIEYLRRFPVHDLKRLGM
ncbi:MAG: hypothetical protein IT269_04970, partial [Saprospiraceae bacterium]|nr:hypothetical protein [Saprospiraceae bacterium]